MLPSAISSTILFTLRTKLSSEGRQSARDRRSSVDVLVDMELVVMSIARRSRLVDFGCRSSENMPHLSDRTTPEAIIRTTGPSSLPSTSGFSLYPFFRVCICAKQSQPSFNTLYLDIRVNNLLRGMEGVPKGICWRITQRCI